MKKVVKVLSVIAAFVLSNAHSALSSQAQGYRHQIQGILSAPRSINTPLQNLYETASADIKNAQAFQDAILSLYEEQLSFATLEKSKKDILQEWCEGKASENNEEGYPKDVEFKKALTEAWIKKIITGPSADAPIGDEEVENIFEVLSSDQPFLAPGLLIGIASNDASHPLIKFALQVRSMITRLKNPNYIADNLQRDSSMSTFQESLIENEIFEKHPRLWFYTASTLLQTISHSEEARTVVVQNMLQKTQIENPKKFSKFRAAARSWFRSYCGWNKRWFEIKSSLSGKTDEELYGLVRGMVRNFKKVKKLSSILESDSTKSGALQRFLERVSIVFGRIKASKITSEAQRLLSDLFDLDGTGKFIQKHLISQLPARLQKQFIDATLEIIKEKSAALSSSTLRLSSEQSTTANLNLMKALEEAKQDDPTETKGTVPGEVNSPKQGSTTTVSTQKGSTGQNTSDKQREELERKQRLENKGTNEVVSGEEPSENLTKGVRE